MKKWEELTSEQREALVTDRSPAYYAEKLLKGVPEYDAAYLAYCEAETALYTQWRDRCAAMLAARYELDTRADRARADADRAARLAAAVAPTFSWQCPCGARGDGLPTASLRDADRAMHEAGCAGGVRPGAFIAGEPATYEGPSAAPTKPKAWMWRPDGRMWFRADANWRQAPDAVRVVPSGHEWAWMVRRTGHGWGREGTAPTIDEAKRAADAAAAEWWDLA